MESLALFGPIGGSPTGIIANLMCNVRQCNASAGPYAWSLGVQQVLNDLQAEQPVSVSLDTCKLLETALKTTSHLGHVLKNSTFSLAHSTAPSSAEQGGAALDTQPASDGKAPGRASKG